MSAAAAAAGGAGAVAGAGSGAAGGGGEPREQNPGSCLPSSRSCNPILQASHTSSLRPATPVA